MEMPALEKEATRSLQEENLELHQQVSLLSQWNDKHEQTISTLEQQLETLDNDNKQLSYQLTQTQALEQVCGEYHCYYQFMTIWPKSEKITVL